MVFFISEFVIFGFKVLLGGVVLLFYRVVSGWDGLFEKMILE